MRLFGQGSCERRRGEVSLVSLVRRVRRARYRTVLSCTVLYRGRVGLAVPGCAGGRCSFGVPVVALPWCDGLGGVDACAGRGSQEDQTPAEMRPDGWANRLGRFDPPSNISCALPTDLPNPTSIRLHLHHISAAQPHLRIHTRSQQSNLTCESNNQQPANPLSTLVGAIYSLSCLEVGAQCSGCPQRATAPSTAFLAATSTANSVVPSVAQWLT
jgi:hypothetical protein